MKKRGSHVGFMLSFIIFVTFMIFLYSMLEPLVRNQRTKEAVLESVKLKVIDEISGEVNTTTLEIDEEYHLTGKKCLKFTDVDEEIIDSEKLIIRDESEENLEYNVISADKHLYIKKGADDDNKFFKIYSSGEFSIDEIDLNPCDEVQKASYSLGLVKTENSIFESKIATFVSDYALNYATLKANMGIAETTEFSVRFLDADKAVIYETEQRGVSTSVYADDFLIQYFDEEMDLLIGFIEIRVW